MKGVALELLNSGNGGKLRPIERTARHYHEARTENVAAISLDYPAPGLLVPVCVFDLSLKTGAFVEIEVSAIRRACS
jgi:hypothetical protein